MSCQAKSLVKGVPELSQGNIPKRRHWSKIQRQSCRASEYNECGGYELGLAGSRQFRAWQKARIKSERLVSQPSSKSLAHSKEGLVHDVK